MIVLLKYKIIKFYTLFLIYFFYRYDLVKSRSCYYIYFEWKRNGISKVSKEIYLLNCLNLTIEFLNPIDTRDRLQHSNLNDRRLESKGKLNFSRSFVLTYAFDGLFLCARWRRNGDTNASTICEIYEDRYKKIRIFIYLRPRKPEF